jgi:branched-chain amino acid aminotransferase
VVVDGEVLTPPLDSGCLAGVTRALVLEAGMAVERPLPLTALLEASEAFLTSTTRLGQPISHVDGRPLGPPGAATLAVQRMLCDLLDRTLEP